MQKVINRGFTLIELLVVIAIIGILASIVLVSLGSARSKGADAGIKGDLDSIRTQMEVYSSNNSNSYNNACTGDPTIVAALANAASLAGGTVNAVAATAGTTGTVTCHATSTTNWVVEAPLKAGGMWCVDSSGTAVATAGTTVPANDGSCN